MKHSIRVLKHGLFEGDNISCCYHDGYDEIGNPKISTIKNGIITLDENDKKHYICKNDIKIPFFAVFNIALESRGYNYNKYMETSEENL